MEDSNWWQAHRDGEDDNTLAGLIPSSNFQEKFVIIHNLDNKTAIFIVCFNKTITLIIFLNKLQY